MSSNISLVLTVVLASCALTASYPSNHFPSIVGPNYDNVPRCLQPVERGLCLAYFKSFFYDASSGKCQSFVYGGCRGNLNRFGTEEECMRTCSETATDSKPVAILELETIRSNPVAQDTCTLPKDSGRCYALFYRYYFNGEKCETFIYGGCGGNSNKFETEEDCLKACPASRSVETVNKPVATLEIETIRSNPEVPNTCTLPKDSGLCYAAFSRYYFNGEKCEVFTYGGCGGNTNNFETEEDCLKACPSTRTEENKVEKS